MNHGCLIGIGVGPGDPELLTLKAIRTIGACPVVAFVSAGGRASFARAIASAHIGPGQREIGVTLPMNPHPEHAEAAYDEGAARIAAELEAGHDVALLCEGDPLLYGSFIHFLARIGQRYPCRVIPGVTSVSAAAAAACLPLVWRRRSFVVLPATMAEPLLEQRLRAADAAAILKVGRHLEVVRDVLRRAGALERALLVERASTENERIVPLADVTSHRAPYFSLILVPGPPA